MDHVLGRKSENSGCRLSWRTDRIIDDAVIFVATTEVLSKALESFSEEVEPLGHF